MGNMLSCGQNQMPVEKDFPEKTNELKERTKENQVRRKRVKCLHQDFGIEGGK